MKRPRPQRQPNEWSCLPTSFAICLGVPVHDIFDWVGHDGSEIIYQGVPEPYCRRSFHPQEIFDYCYFKHNIAIMQIERNIQLINASSEVVYSVPLNERRINKYLRSIKLLVASGQVKSNKKWHAVAKVKDTIYDPNGTTQNAMSFFDNFNIEVLFLILT